MPVPSMPDRSSFPPDQSFALAELEEASPSGFMAFAAVREGGARITDFEWIYANPAARQIVGRMDSELRGLRLLVEMPGNRETGLFDHYVRVVETGAPFQHEFQYAFEGLDCWFEATATALRDGFVVRFRDISMRVRSEQRLRASEDEFRRLAASLPDVVARFDREGRHLLVNPAVERATGRPAAEFVGKTNGDLGMPEDAVRLWDSAIQRAFDGEEVSLSFGFGEGDAQRQFQSRVVPERDKEGRIVSVLSIARDVTDLARQAAQLREKSEFEEQLIGIVSHDLKNPLQAVLMSASLSLRRGGLDERTLKTLQRIHATAERAARMVRDLLDFTQARLGKGLPLERRPTVLGDLLEETAEEVRAAHPERELFVIHQGRHEGIWDPDRLSQAVGNLLVNALVYGEPGTPVTLRTGGTSERPCFTVHNLGAPIPEAALGTLFRPLHRGTTQVDKSTRSIGLGLYIVKEIVRAHGGTVRVHSNAADGTTFTVDLPRVGPSLPEPDPV